MAYDVGGVPLGVGGDVAQLFVLSELQERMAIAPHVIRLGLSEQREIL